MRQARLFGEADPEGSLLLVCGCGTEKVVLLLSRKPLKPLQERDRPGFQHDEGRRQRSQCEEGVEWHRWRMAGANVSPEEPARTNDRTASKGQCRIRRHRGEAAKKHKISLSVDTRRK